MAGDSADLPGDALLPVDVGYTSGIQHALGNARHSRHVGV